MTPPVSGPTGDPTTAPRHGPFHGWQAVHVGLENDGLRIDDLDVWSLDWQPDGESDVILPHPAHPQQRHDFTLYRIEDGGTAARFAAAELSNGVWGFYRWIGPGEANDGTSADGRLRYLHHFGAEDGFRTDRGLPIARLERMADGAPLFDGAMWDSSRILPQADGSLLLVLFAHNDETLFRIDPAADSLSDLAATAPAVPLEQLSEAAQRAHAAATARWRRDLERRVAPDGSFTIEFQAIERMNSAWVHAPRLIDTATRRVLLDLWNGNWDATAVFERPGCVRLGMRAWPGGFPVTVEVDAAHGRYHLVAPGETALDGPLDQLPGTLAGLADQHWVTPAPPPHPAPVAGPRQIGVALLILLGTLALVAVITWFTEFRDPPAKQPLTPIPAFRPD